MTMWHCVVGVVMGVLHRVSVVVWRQPVMAAMQQSRTSCKIVGRRTRQQRLRYHMASYEESRASMCNWFQPGWLQVPLGAQPRLGAELKWI
jgi:hypothetical protein